MRIFRYSNLQSSKFSILKFLNPQTFKYWNSGIFEYLNFRTFQFSKFQTSNPLNFQIFHHSLAFQISKSSNFSIEYWNFLLLNKFQFSNIWISQLPRVKKKEKKKKMFVPFTFSNFYKSSNSHTSGSLKNP